MNSETLVTKLREQSRTYLACRFVSEVGLTVMLKQAMARVDARARASYAIALTRAFSRLLFLEALFL